MVFRVVFTDCGENIFSWNGVTGIFGTVETFDCFTAGATGDFFVTGYGIFWHYFFLLFAFDFLRKTTLHSA